MSHLGRLVSPLADGQLTPARAERAFAHIAGCAQCRQALDAERASQAAARSAGEVRASPDLTERLLALQVPGVPAGGPSPAGAAGRLTPVRHALLPAGARHPLRSRVLAGTLASLGAVALTLFVLGGQQRPPQAPSAILDAGASSTGLTQLVPGVDRRAATPTQERMSATVLEWMAASGWVAPAALPAGMSVSDVEVHDALGRDGASVDLLELRLTGAGRVVTVLEQHGRLDPAMLAALEPVRIGDHLVYEVDHQWWVLECGDSVVAVTSGVTPGPAHAVIRELPSMEDTYGVMDRIDDGWTVLVGAF